jgi:hypothetical protein
MSHPIYAAVPFIFLGKARSRRSMAGNYVFLRDPVKIKTPEPRYVYQRLPPIRQNAFVSAL